MAKRALLFSLVYYPDFVGGAEVAVKEITDRIDSDDIEFHMVTLRAGGRERGARLERIGNVTVHRVGIARSKGLLFALDKYLFPFLAPLRASYLHKQLHFDFTWSVMANFAGFAALFFKLFHMNVPFLLTLQEGDPIEYIQNESFKVKIGWLHIPVRPLVYPLFKMIFTHADRIQAISNHLADFARRMGAKAEPVVVPNGVDVDKFSRFMVGTELETVKREIGKAQGDFFLVTASRLVAKNAVGDIVASLAHLPKNVKLLVIGSGELEQTLKRQAKDLGVDGRVIFKGFVPHQELPAYLQACDIFVRPSLSEGFGNSFIEAMASGLPVIATPVGGIVDFLKDKQTGLFCEVNSPQDIARKAEIFIRDAALREEVIDNAMHMVVDHYDWKKIAADMKERAFQGF